ncbi:hypothetical protein RHSIM_Rhsim05G0180400 [Rhododendron simsii]|uniref:RRM domain-containing protein n=1 Tax=Rhododendron simsii TaxID=118357 RepID=A0A834LMQ0_RHOSS|nr:hypothetical protein RHSIM_Rhsim05G0180400 [Rhododendron simsii]
MSSSATSLHFLSLTPNSLPLSSSKPTPSLSSLPLSRLPSPKSLLSLPSPFLHFPSRLVVARNVSVSSEFEQDEEEVALSDEEEPSFSPDLKVFVGNLPFSVDSSTLSEVFERAGNVEMVEVIYDKITGRSRGFGFVTMSTAEEAEAAARELNGYELAGRELRVNYGPPPPREESSFRGSRGGGSGGSFGNTNRLYVGNLSWGVDDMTLENVFSEHGKVIEARVICDRESGRSRGFGFVTYGSADEVNSAIEALDGAEDDRAPLRESDCIEIEGIALFDRVEWWNWI